MPQIADNSEFRATLYDLVREDYGKEAVKMVTDAYPEAVAIWLKHGGDSNEDGHFFGRNNEFVFRLNKVPAQPGHGVAEGIEEAEHYALHIKASSKMLEVLSKKFGLEVKNG